MFSLFGKRNGAVLEAPSTMMPSEAQVPPTVQAEEAWTERGEAAVTQRLKPFSAIDSSYHPPFVAGYTGGGIACSATQTSRAASEANEDANSVCVLPDGFPAALLADGLGSYERAGEASRLAVAAARHHLVHEAMPVTVPMLRDIFLTAHDRLRDYAATSEGGENDAQVALTVSIAQAPPARLLGTTLLMAVETPETLHIAYAGNGGIFHLRGDFLDWGDAAPLPWSFVNYLNPHSVSENGREALTRFLSPSGDRAQATPTVLSVQKDAACGDILLLCSDGIFSHDQTVQGAAPDGSVWTQLDEPMIVLHHALRAAFREMTNHVSGTEEAEVAGTNDADERAHQCGQRRTASYLQRALQASLDTLRAHKQLDDDATVCLLVTERALSYARERAHEAAFSGEE